VARGPLEEPGPQVVLEQADLAPERGWQHRELSRRVAEVQLIGNGYEAPKVMEFHARLLAGLSPKTA
jgi:hypothetical protein